MRAYAFLGDAQVLYQSAVVELLRERSGIDIAPLERGSLSDLDVIAGGVTALLFLCGLPYVRLRDRGFPVRPLAAPVASAHVDEPPGYRSLLLGRPGLAGAELDQLTGLRLGINGRDSMSGWVLPVAFGLPLERCDSIATTGAHLQSMEALLRGDIDVAPIDSMLLTAEAAQRPELAELPVLATYGPAPSPPIVLVGGDDALAESLAEQLVRLHQDDEGRAALALGSMARLDRMADADYDPIRSSDREAATCTR